MSQLTGAVALQLNSAFCGFCSRAQIAENSTKLNFCSSVRSCVSVYAYVHLGILLWTRGRDTLASFALPFNTANHQGAREFSKHTVVARGLCVNSFKKYTETEGNILYSGFKCYLGISNLIWHIKICRIRLIFTLVESHHRGQAQAWLRETVCLKKYLPTSFPTKWNNMNLNTNKNF